MAIHRKILRWLENELFEGNIQLGQDLPSDSEIARAIGVGRSRTREALRTLEDMDLVQLYNGRGKEMLVHLSDEPAAAASAALRLHMSSSRYPTRDLVQTRILLESWAIARIDPKTVSFAEMDEVLEQMEDFDLSIRDFLELLLTFHHQVMRCGGNELLVGLLASVRQPSFESMLSLVGRMPLWSSAVERLRAESRAIAEALKAGDAATARAMVIGQLRGMYSDAGIDLEQEATSANGLPGEPIASEFAPVDVDEFAADDFDDLLQDDPSFADAEALPAADAPVAAPASVAPASVAPASDSVQASAPSSVVEYTVPEGDIVYIEETAAETPVERVDEPAEVLSSSNASGSDKVERSIPAVAQPAPAAAPATPAQPTAHSVSADVPLSFGTPRRSTPVAQVTPAASAAPVASVAASSQTLASQPLSSQTLSSQTPSGQLPSVPAAYAQEEAEGPAKVLRASTAAPRRRSGQIISPVRATIIKPVDRSKVLTAPARTARPAAVVTAAAPAETEPAEKVLRAPARQEAPATEPAEPTRLEAAATIHDTYEKLPHDEPVQERGGIFSKMKRFFGVDVYEPEHDEAQESAEKEQVLKAETKPESQPEPQPVIDEEALARAEAERAERLKALHAAAEEEAAEESAVEEVSVEEPVEEPVEASDPAQESVEAASSAEESTPDAAVASSGSVLSHGRAKGSKKSKKKRR